MNTLLRLTVANMKGLVRDRAALFWTFAFPILFVILFGYLAAPLFPAWMGLPEGEARERGHDQSSAGPTVVLRAVPRTASGWKEPDL